MPRQRLLDRQYHLLALVAIGLGLGPVSSLFAEQAAGGQDAVHAAIERQDAVSTEKRAALYQQLNRQAEVLQAQAAVVKTVAKLTGPSVVHIEADVTGRTALLHGHGSRVEEAGSGVIIQWNDKHFVLTNRHVISGAPPGKIAPLGKININLADGRLIHPAQVWEDVETDVAVMAVSAPDLVAAPIGDSRSIEIGDFVLAVGSPFGLRYSVTYGIVSAKGRRGLQLGQSGVGLQDFIQTDAAINPGNSGGPLINLRGEVVGINTAIASNSGGSEGIGFAIPIDLVMVVARQLIEKGKVSRAFLGVTLDRNFGPEQAAKLGLPRLRGAQIMEVRANSPAAAAKLEVGDVILQIDDVPIEDDNHLVNVVKLSEVGKVISLLVFRDGRKLSVKTTLANSDEFQPESPR